MVNLHQKPSKSKKKSKYQLKKCHGHGQNIYLNDYSVSTTLEIFLIFFKKIGLK